MVKNFNLAKTPRILFGPGKINLLPLETEKLGKKILILTGNKSSSEFIEKNIVNTIRSNCVSINLEKISKEPDSLVIDNLCNEYKNKNIEVIISIGGGSVIDAGKALSAMLLTEGSIIDYLEGVGIKSPNGSKIPFIAIPTTSGTGSEATKNAVISKTGKNGFKRSLRHDNFVPDVAIVDPELTITCPPEITAYSGMDAFSQLLEAYLSVKANNYTDAVSLSGIESIKESLLPAFLDGKNISARTGMAYASLLSGIVLTNAGLGIIHGFAASIGGYIDIPHGVVCGTLMSVCNKQTINKLQENDPKNIAIDKYIRVAKIFIEGSHKSKTYLLDKFIEKLEVYSEMFILPKLSSYGIDSDSIKVIAGITDNKNNPYVFTKDEMVEILKTRL